MTGAPPVAGSSLPEIRNPDCSLCPLSDGVRTICMMGSGPLKARLMIVGEAPGWTEDREGRPFVGPAGQRLNQELARVGLDRSEVFVTNVNRCRPPDNRTPTRAEQKACRPYLDAEIALVKPELILLLGNAALQGMTGQSGILSKRGAAFEKNGLTFFPTVHPAAILRNPAWEPYFVDDIAAVKRLLDGKNTPPVTKVHLIRTPARLRRFLALLSRVETPIAFDVETNTLEWWAENTRLDTVAFSWKPGVAWVIALEHPEQMGKWFMSPSWEQDYSDEIYPALNKALAGKKLVGHNVKFDLHWLASRGVEGYAHFDTMLAAHLLDENRSHGLKPLSRTYLGAELYEQAAHDRFREGETTPLEGEDGLAVYNGRDADYTLRHYHNFRAELIAKPRLGAIFTRLTMPALRALCQIERRGFPVDIQRLADRAIEVNRKLLDLEQQMLQYVQFPDDGLMSVPNFRSTKFLAYWLFSPDQLGFPIITVSVKSNEPSTDRTVLYELQQRFHHPAIDLLMEYRKWSKWNGTYIENWIERLARTAPTQADQTGRRLYPSYNLAGTVTGRLSSDFQQVPRDPYIRSIIGAPDGWVLLDADFSQIELRVIAMISGDKAMLAAYQAGQDLHALTAAALTGKPVDQVEKKERQIAKSANFGLVYGMGWPNFREYARINYGVEISDEQAQFIKGAFFARYPGLGLWHDRMKRLVHANAWVQSPIGRIRRLPTITSSDKDMVAVAERQAINSPVQGFASDLTLLAMTAIERELDQRYARVLGNLHDSIIVEVKEDHAQKVAAIVQQAMESTADELPHLFGFRPTVPIVAEVKQAKHWGGD